MKKRKRRGNLYKTRGNADWYIYFGEQFENDWATEKGEHCRTDAFKLWCWRRFLRVPWITRKSNQSILKEISPKYSLEGLMLKLKL